MGGGIVAGAERSGQRRSRRESAMAAGQGTGDAIMLIQTSDR